MDGLWGHNIMLPNRKYPAYSACAKSDNSDAECPLCNENAKYKIREDKPFGMRRLGWAIGTIVAQVEQGKLTWGENPQSGLVEKGVEFWKELTRAELEAAKSDELNPNKVVLEPDWRTFLFKVTVKEKGIAAEAIPVPKSHPRPILTEDQLSYWMDLFSKRIQPWDGLDRIAEKQREQREKAMIENIAPPGAIVQRVPNIPQGAGNLLVAEHTTLLALPIKAQDGTKLDWPVFLVKWMGQKYSQHVTFTDLSLVDRKAVIKFMHETAEKQGLKPPFTLDEAIGPDF
jgi:hypothetical protein